MELPTRIPTRLRAFSDDDEYKIYVAIKTELVPRMKIAHDCGISLPTIIAILRRVQKRLDTGWLPTVVHEMAEGDGA